MYIDYNLVHVCKDGSINLYNNPFKDIFRKLIILNSLKDFNVKDYNRKQDIVIRFKDCNHVFTFGNVDAYLMHNDTYYSEIGSAGDLFSWAIAFGNGDAINKGHGPAVTFGRGDALSYNKSITFGTGDAIIKTAIDVTEPPKTHRHLYAYYKKYIKFLHELDKYSSAESFGLGAVLHEHTINGYQSTRAVRGIDHGYINNKKIRRWSRVKNIPGLLIDDMYLNVSILLNKRSFNGVDVFNVPLKDVDMDKPMIKMFNGVKYNRKDICDSDKLVKIYFSSNESIAGLTYHFLSDEVKCSY